MKINKNTFVFTCLLLIFLFQYPIQSQPIVTLTKSPMITQGPGVQVLYFSDFDLLKKGVAEELFFIKISNIDDNYDDTWIEIELILDGQLVASAISEPFTLLEPTNPDYWRASNAELINFETFPGSGVTIVFTTKIC